MIPQALGHSQIFAVPEPAAKAIRFIDKTRQFHPAMKLRTAIAASALLAASAASAQIADIVNQIPGLIQPALSGSLNYKGFVETGFAGGFGDYRANVFSVSTSQGFRYSNWFFMGAGIGLDVMIAGGAPSYDAPAGYNDWDDPHFSHKNTRTAFFLPVFTDFRFNIGGNGGTKPSFFIDIKAGATFMINNSYFHVGKGYITNRESFYLKPSLGVRIPVNKQRSSQAFNIGLTYQLVTANWWHVGDRNISLNAIGGSVAYEW